MPRKISIGKCPLHTDAGPVRGGIVEIDGHTYYKISGYDRMPPFFMSLSSHSDCWIFISSNGGMTAGRKNPDHALFPYYTDDRIHDSRDQSGSRTLILADIQDRTCLWEPFSARFEGMYETERNLYKHMAGHCLIFEEKNPELDLLFHVWWTSCDRFGVIRKSVIRNCGSKSVRIRVLDGMQNILPAGTDRKFQLEYSTLLDGYKRNELLAESGVGLYTLSAIPTDKAEPSEALRAATVWSAGLENPVILLSDRQTARFRSGSPVAQETDIRGRRGAYYLSTEFSLSPVESRKWLIAANPEQDSAEVTALDALIRSEHDTVHLIEQAVSEDCACLIRKVARADGIQCTRDLLNTSRHFSNCLFNIMRGGVFENNGAIGKTDFLRFLSKASHRCFREYRAFLDAFPELLTHEEFIHRIETKNDPDLEKLAYEYLPLTFSRRHGDPSRPWNLFSIELKDEQGEKTLNYQGNWRDIFQNWEALGFSFPCFIEGMIFKFVNASTADGYNPYRITRDGFDWEELDPSDAWSHIGYWGDHQIIYLLKLLELSDRFHPGKLKGFLSKNCFAYADVPYRIRDYKALVRNPKSTIDFDFDLNERIGKRVKTLGTDGKFVQDHEGKMVHATLTEKLLIPLLTKLSNFIPEAGIWMNTQRPEWNDANNALVGTGCSMVTLYYCIRYIRFCKILFQKSESDTLQISEEVQSFYSMIGHVLTEFQHILDGPVNAADRKAVTDRLGRAGSEYRNRIYSHGFSGIRGTLPVDNLISFLDTASALLEHSVRTNRREDGLYHAYNLVNMEPDKITIRHLYEMLEGQVAVLSSGCLSIDESIHVLQALRHSGMYRADQNSYMLYPDRDLPKFMEKNSIPGSRVRQSKPLSALLRDKDRSVVVQDCQGRIHFNADLRNAGMLQAALRSLKESGYAEFTDEESGLVLNIYESVFDHQSFTGRSGTFYKYEGLGCIYWHMVSKLLLAVQETFFRALESGANFSLLDQLKILYRDIREGIGVHKTPDLYGAFPTDPYSHTPGFTGVQQPGMTGQVKEDILTRFGEFGIVVRLGRIEFNPVLLEPDEWITESRVFVYVDVKGEERSISLKPGSLAFTFCQVPVIYTRGSLSGIRIIEKDGSARETDQKILDEKTSRSVFERSGLIDRIEVTIDN
ncbi:hypothetical protein JW948_16405 [bacterium]|nr:hypothetical protein [bacterium]